MTVALRWVARLIALVSLTLWQPSVGLAETPIPPAPRTWATDNAKLLSAQTVSDLNDRLQAYEAKTGHQVLVYIASTTGGVPIEDWAVKAFAQWKVGRKNLDDGLVLFIFPQDRTVRIEVGYGLESTVPDVIASRIIRETIAPALQAGQPDRGVTSAVDQLLQRIGDTSSNSGTTADNGGGGDEIALSPIQLVLIGLVLFGLLVLAVRNPWLALSLLINIVGSRGGGFSSGGGGFSGGGGRSGGGGASGSW
jgi:uncharacterized protein